VSQLVSLLQHLLMIAGAVTAVGFLVVLVALMAIAVDEDVKRLAQIHRNNRFANHLFNQIEEFRNDFP
jgi:hypothetical protein